MQLRSGWTSIKAAVRARGWPLVALGVSGLNLSGPLGPLHYYLPQLAMLDASQNRLSGVLPPDLALYGGQLQALSLAGNELRGAQGVALGIPKFGMQNRSHPPASVICMCHCVPLVACQLTALIRVLE